MVGDGIEKVDARVALDEVLQIRVTPNEHPLERDIGYDGWNGREYLSPPAFGGRLNRCTTQNQHTPPGFLRRIALRYLARWLCALDFASLFPFFLLVEDMLQTNLHQQLLLV